MEAANRQDSSARSWLSLSLSRNASASNSVLDLKGPYGLNTLYDPESPPVADLIFVHGLGGGSKSTWSKSNDTSLYWPKEWLPNEPNFKNVRVHSYGYNSKLDKQSILSLHDFAKNLLGSIQDSLEAESSANVCHVCLLPPVPDPELTDRFLANAINRSP